MRRTTVAFEDMFTAFPDQPQIGRLLQPKNVSKYLLTLDGIANASLDGHRRYRLLW